MTALNEEKRKFNKIFGVPLSKDMSRNDAGDLIVRGIFTSENKDEVGDIISRGATERALEKYRQWGNIRYMHQPRPVGTVLRIGDGELDWNEVELAVVDQDAAYQVEKGLLKALSVGIVMGWDDIEFLDDGGWYIKDYTLAEISLVDHPANYDAKLDLAITSSPEFRELARAKGIFEAAITFGVSDTKDMPEAQTEEVSENKSPACRESGESVEDCVSRKIPEILGENPEMDQDQASAIAYSMCEDLCEEEGTSTEEASIEPEEDNMSDVQLTEEEIVVEQTIEEDEVEADVVLENSLEQEETNAETVELEAAIDEDEADINVEFETLIVDDSDDVTNKDILVALTKLNELLAKALEAKAIVEEEIDEPLETIEPSDKTGNQDSNPDYLELLERVAELEAQLAELKAPHNRQAPVNVVDETEIDEEDVEGSEKFERNMTLRDKLHTRFGTRSD